MGTSTLKMLAAVGVTLMVALVPSACTSNTQESSDSASSASSVSIATVGSSDFAPVFVAQEQGLFAEERIDASIEVVQSAAQTVVALQSGSADIAPVATASLLQATSNGIDLVIVSGAAVASTTDKNYALVSTGGQREPEDFVGTTVGVNALDSFFHVLFREWLDRGGVEADSVNYVQVPLGSMADALISGTVNATLAPQPFLAVAAAVDGATVTYLAEDLFDDFQPFVYATTRSFAEQHPDVIAGFRNAMADAVRLVSEDPDLARADFGEYVNLTDEALAAVVFNPLTVDVTPEQIEPWATMMQNQGMLTEAPDVESLILN